MATASVNGADLYYEEHGSGDPLLLIHGTGANVRIWGRTVDDLAASNRVIAYDRRGFGQSSGPMAKHLSQHADDAAMLLRVLDAEPALVVAWSGGGVVGLDMAARHPDSVHSLVLAEAALHLARNLTLSTLKMTARMEFSRRIKRDQRAAALAMFEWALGYTTGGNAFERYPEDWQESMLASAPAVLRELDQLGRSYPSRAQSGSISCPVTCLEGDLSDPAFHKATRYLRKLLPAAGPVEIEGAAHAMHFDQPEEFAAAVRNAAREERAPAPA